jgi:hypothetical protein
LKEYETNEIKSKIVEVLGSLEGWCKREPLIRLVHANEGKIMHCLQLLIRDRVVRMKGMGTRLDPHLYKLVKH